MNRDWVEKDFYKELGVTSDASKDEIKRAARKILAENHLVRNPRRDVVTVHRDLESTTVLKRHLNRTARSRPGLHNPAVPPPLHDAGAADVTDLLDAARRVNDTSSLVEDHHVVADTLHIVENVS